MADYSSGGFFGEPQMIELGTMLADQDRRKSKRLSIPGRLYFRQIGTHVDGPQSGYGKVVNLSGCGLLFTSDTVPPMNALLELHIEWPARLDGQCPLKLVIYGEVVRSERAQAAVKFQKSEFRTRGTVLAGAERRATATPGLRLRQPAT